MMKTIILTTLLNLTSLVYADQKPNMVFILSDDQGYGDLGCYGATNIYTPNVDSIVRQGIKFTSFYVHNRCSPKRAAFMTCGHAQRVDMEKVIYHRDKSSLNPGEITVAKLMQDVGYATGINGKWHLGEWPQFNPVTHGFAYFLGRIAEQKEQCLYENLETVGTWGSKEDRFCSKKPLPVALQFMRQHKEQPFFLYYASNIPHTKWITHADFQGSSKQGKLVAELIHKTFIVPGATIRSGEWKLLVKDQKPGGGRNKGMQGRKHAAVGSMFNLQDDLGETRNVSEHSLKKWLI